MTNISSVHGLFEFEQEHFTHHSSTGTSKLDRVYMNVPVVDQLDYRIGCVALSWLPPTTSSHRPISFRHEAAPAKLPAERSLPARVFSQNGWALLVHLRHGELLRAEAQEREVSGIRSLVLLKRAIVKVSGRMAKESAPWEPDCDDMQRN